MKARDDDGQGCDTCAFVRDCMAWRNACGDDLFRDHYGCYVNKDDAKRIKSFNDKREKTE